MPYFLNDSTVVSLYQKAWGDSFNIDSFVQTCRTMVEAKIMGYGYAYINVHDMLYGFENDVAAKINGGQFYQGNDFSLSNFTAPIINDMSGLQASVPYGMYTGSNGIDEIGRLRIMNNQADVNRLFTLWNGTAMVNTTLTNPSLSSSEKELNGVSAGMQFPPDVQEDDSLRVYDPRLLKIASYSHEESQTLGDNLPLEKY